MEALARITRQRFPERTSPSRPRLDTLDLGGGTKVFVMPKRVCISLELYSSRVGTLGFLFYFYQSPVVSKSYAVRRGASQSKSTPERENEIYIESLTTLSGVYLLYLVRRV